MFSELPFFHNAGGCDVNKLQSETVEINSFALGRVATLSLAIHSRSPDSLLIGFPENKIER